MAHLIFSIPEILHLIFKRIFDFHIAPLLFVSRHFFICAVPFAWESIDSPRKLCRLVFPDVKLNKIDNTWISNIQPLNDRDLDRFNFYAPHVKRVHHFGRRGQVGFWTVILRAVPKRPLLPNLRSLSIYDDMQLIPTIQVLGALACPTIVDIRAPGLDWSSGFSRPVLSPQLMAQIAESCPNLHHLEAYDRASRPRPHDMAIPGTSPSANSFSSLGQLHSLRTLGAGPEVLSSDMLMMMGSLPSLEALKILIPHDTPRQMIPNNLPPLPDSFLALRVLCWSYYLPALTSQLWKTLPFVQRLTSVSIKAEYDSTTNSEDLCDLVSTICRFSPNVTDLHLDFSMDDTDEVMVDIDLFTPTVISDLSRLPLQCVQILTPDTDSELLPPEDYEQFALALSNVEYLEIQDCCFTYHDMEYVAKHMPKLRFLAVSLASSDWPSREELPLAPSSSPSVICLQSSFTADWWSRKRNDNTNYIDSLSTALYRLWPNGVHCIFSEFAGGGARQPDYDELALINAKIKEMCSPNQFSIPDTEPACRWQYSNAPWFYIYRF